MSGSFAAIAPRLAIGQTLVVVDRNQLETRGVLSGMTPTSLSLMIDGHERNFTEQNVRTIFVESRRTGRGAWVGLGVGIGVGVGTFFSTVTYGSVSGLFVISALFGGIGAGIGAAAGSAVVHRERIYDADIPARQEGVLSSVRPNAVSAQEALPNLARPRPDRSWTTSVVMGTTSSGPARDFEQAMHAADFDRTPHPDSHTGFGETRHPWHVSVRRRLSSRYGVGFASGHASMGYTSGQKRNTFDRLDTLDRLDVTYGVTTLGPVFVVGPAPGFQPSVGPDFYSVTTEGGTPNWEEQTSDTDHSVGLVTQLGLAVPPRSRVFGEVSADYGYVGDVETGPFSTVGHASRAVSTLPATRVGMNHWFVGFAAAGRSAPARVDGSDDAASAIGDEEQNAVGRANGDPTRHRRLNRPSSTP